MPIHWRTGGGGGMATINLAELTGDQIVIHFGGALTSVDVYTFGNSLIAFADTVRSVNAVLNPGQNIEVRLEAVGPGSFRAVIKRLKKGLGIFSQGVDQIFWAIVATLIYDHLIKTDPKMEVTVNPDEVIIQKNGDRIIIPRNVYSQLPSVKADPEVRKNLSKTFQIIEEDPAIENFGLTPRVDDPEPLVQIPRDEFPRLATIPRTTEINPRRRERTERVKLVVLKAWLVPGTRKWSFEWNGVPISAPIRDQSFFDRLAKHEVLLGQGDALDVELRYEQEFNEELGLYVNDTQTFEVMEVFSVISRGRQGRLST